MTSRSMLECLKGRTYTVRCTKNLSGITLEQLNSINEKLLVQQTSLRNKSRLLFDALVQINNKAKTIREARKIAYSVLQKVL